MIAVRSNKTACRIPNSVVIQRTKNAYICQRLIIISKYLVWLYYPSRRACVSIIYNFTNVTQAVDHNNNFLSLVQQTLFTSTSAKVLLVRLKKKFQQFSLKSDRVEGNVYVHWDRSVSGHIYWLYVPRPLRSGRPLLTWDKPLLFVYGISLSENELISTFFSLCLPGSQ